jgi:hypothetical protein
MRPSIRLALAASTFLALAAVPLASGAFAQANPSAVPEAKPVTLTQAEIDGVIKTQPAIQAIEAKAPAGGEDKPDPKAEAQLDAAVKKNGFKDIGDYSDVSSAIGVVLAGIDPETKTYVGPDVVLKKQIAQVEADKTMPPKEKKEALDELKAALGTASGSKPSAANIDLVTKNFDKLNESMKGDAN